MTGIDYLSVDEAHDYKNLKTVSNIPNVGIEGSQRAADLDMKLGYLRDTHGGRVATLATATPIANSVAEAYTMQRYLRPDLLDAAGLTDFDTWAATFGEVVTGIELSPDGGRVRMQSRFARFKNVPELLRMWHVSAEVKTAQDLQLVFCDLGTPHQERWDVYHALRDLLHDRGLPVGSVLEIRRRALHLEPRWCRDLRPVSMQRRPPAPGSSGSAELAGVECGPVEGLRRGSEQDPEWAVTGCTSCHGGP